jgi:hypothetical protein
LTWCGPIRSSSSLQKSPPCRMTGTRLDRCLGRCSRLSLDMRSTPGLSSRRSRREPAARRFYSRISARAHVVHQRRPRRWGQSGGGPKVAPVAGGRRDLRGRAHAAYAPDDSLLHRGHRPCIPRWAPRLSLSRPRILGFISSSSPRRAPGHRRHPDPNHQQLYRFLAADAMWRELEVTDKTAFFACTDAPAVDPWGEGVVASGVQRSASREPPGPAARETRDQDTPTPRTLALAHLEPVWALDPTRRGRHSVSGCLLLTHSRCSFAASSAIRRRLSAAGKRARGTSPAVSHEVEHSSGPEQYL